MGSEEEEGKGKAWREGLEVWKGGENGGEREEGVVEGERKDIRGMHIWPKSTLGNKQRREREEMESVPSHAELSHSLPSLIPWPAWRAGLLISRR